MSNQEIINKLEELRDTIIQSEEKTSNQIYLATTINALTTAINNGLEFQLATLTMEHFMKPLHADYNARNN